MSMMGLIAEAVPGGGGGGDFLTNLTNFWPMDDIHVSGTTITNTVNGSNPGTSSTSGIGSAAGPNAAYPQGRSIDGAAGSHIQISSPISSYASGSFSIGGWVYLTNNTITEGGNRVCFFSDDKAGDGLTNYLRVFNNNSVGNGSLGVQCSDNGGSTGIASAANTLPATPAWVHFVYTNFGGGAGGVKVLYVNGSAVSTSASSGGGAGAVAAFFGSLDSSVGVMAGRLAALRTWSRALAAIDVSALYNAGAGG